MKSIFRFILGGMVIFTLLGASPAPSAQAVSGSEAALQPLGTLLNSNGMLDLTTGFSGSLDVTGWDLVSGPGEPPRFSREGIPGPRINTRSVAGDEFWDDQFLLGVYYSPQPANSGVFAVAVSGTEVYIGGDFDRAGNVAASRIAKWDSVTHKWSALGSGVNNRVLAISANGDNVYVGGNFTVAGGVSAHYIAHWNDASQTWSALAGELTHTSTSPEVDAIAIAANGNVYVGGEFEKAGNVTVNNIARWDGSWHALGSGIGGLSMMSWPSRSAVAMFMLEADLQLPEA